MNWNKWMRQLHRWVAILFTATVVIVTVVVVAQPEPAEWLLLSPLPPLAFLLVTGLYMFVLPYTRRARSRQRAAPQS